MTGNLRYRTATWLRGEPVFTLIRRYQESQWWDRAALVRYQEGFLDRLLRHAVTATPYYAAVAQERGLCLNSVSAADLERFPLLTKTHLVDRQSDLQAWRLPGTTSWKTTGGSTGVAVRLRKNRWATAAEQAASWRSYAWYGIRPGDRQARFWGTPLSGRGRLRYRAIDWILNRDRFSAFAFGRDDLARYFARLRERPPVWVYGYVSMLVQFATFCLEERLPLGAVGIRAVVTTSEALTRADRDLLRIAFQAPVYDEYGCGELGAVFYECERGSLHLMAENLLAELVPDPTLNRADARRLVLTDLHNYATPLVRYDVGDYVVPAPPCRCGRGLPAFSEVFGRAYDFVAAADGARYHGEFFMYLLEDARTRGAAILQAQFVQTETDRILIRIVPGHGYEPETGQALAAKLEQQCEERFRADFETVPELPRELSGKIRLIRALEPSPPNQGGS